MLLLHMQVKAYSFINFNHLPSIISNVILTLKNNYD